MVSLQSLSIFVKDDVVFSLIKEKVGLALVSLDNNLRVADRIATFKGDNGFILESYRGNLLVDVDDTLFLVNKNAKRAVLKASNPANFFWHGTRAGDNLFINEYGESPTGIYRSTDGEVWERVVINSELDKHSRHFHCVKYDAYRNWLIATLGDRCLNRVVASYDLGRTWQSIYRGPWQFVQLDLLKDRLVFGMDSGIVGGGVGIFNPEIGEWNFVFLKWLGKVRFAQICDLKKLENGFWVAALGAPQAFVISRDLKTWYLLYGEGFSEEFNHNMSIVEGSDFLVCSTGNNVLSFEKNDLEFAFLSNPVMVITKAFSGRLRGLGFNFKHNAEGLCFRRSSV